jgi:hypothetical protein
MDKKQYWFELGAQAVSRVWTKLPFGYVCPLCGTGFPPTEIEQLTFEHAPPASLGGREIAITCKSCNSTAGYSVDINMRRYEDALDFRLGTMTKPVRICLEVAGQVQNATLLSESTGIKIIGLPKCNPPGTGKAITKEIERLIAEGSASNLRFRVTSAQTHSPRLVRRGWLRSAYLVAFALLGYRYAFSDALRPVRDQFIPAGSAELARFHLLIPGVPAVERHLFLIDRPKPFGCLAVQMGRHAVFLPRRTDDLNLFQHLDATTGSEFHSMITDEIEWPNEPRHLMD